MKLQEKVFAPLAKKWCAGPEIPMDMTKRKLRPSEQGPCGALVRVAKVGGVTQCLKTFQTVRASLKVPGLLRLLAQKLSTNKRAQ